MTAMLETGQVLAARYALQRQLGRGPGGETWLAHDRIAGRDVALKFATADVADGQSAERLRRERAALAAIEHPALAPVGVAESSEGRTFLVCDFLPGGDLSRLRGRGWPFILRRVMPIVDALRALHDAGFVHGDVKSANVLLDADGLPKLADLGSSRPIGTPGPAEGSPYGMSPQRYEGAPAAVADDVYAVGALLYELIGGHPPFYPDITPERVRVEVPAPLGGRPAVPAALSDVVARCLAKEPGARPSGMAELGRMLQDCVELPAAGESALTAVAPTAFRPPEEAAPIRPNWTRTTDAGPSAGDLRREGFRRGVLVSGFVLALAAVVFVFFLLPGLVESPGGAKSPEPQPKSVTAAAPRAPSAGEPTAQDLEQLAELKRQAEQLHGPLGKRLAALEHRDAAAWGAAALADARARLATSDAATGRRDFAAAIVALQAAAQTLDGLEKQVPEVLRRLIGEGNAALDAGRSLDATQKFSAALRVDSGSAAARAGLNRARVLDDVLKEVSVASRDEQAGDVRAAAAAYQRALALDPANRSARDGLARLQARASGDAYSTAMAQGLAALARKDYVGARGAFESAGRLRPGAPEVAEGLRQVEQAGRTRDIAATLARARQAEQEERWSAALATYRDALKADATLIEGQQGAERSEPRAMLDAQLQSFVDSPERLFSQDGRGIARSVLARATQVPQPGPRLAGQIGRVSQLLKQAETPIRVAFTSDNATDVQIYRVGKLGLFEHRDFELMPGRYTVVGTRSGYRDVRKEISLLPGAPPPELVIRCEEPI
jgi:tetratricopeptide (TPR) repeat protein